MYQQDKISSRLSYCLKKLYYGNQSKSCPLAQHIISKGSFSTAGIESKLKLYHIVKSKILFDNTKGCY